MNELMIGTAGEYLVCADLIAMGFPAFRADQGAPYDVACDVAGVLVRIQVKTCSQARPYPQKDQRHVTGYSWSGCRGKTKNKRPYGISEIDALAFVALDIKRIAYVPAARLTQIFQIPVIGHRFSKRRFEDFPFNPAAWTAKQAHKGPLL